MISVYDRDTECCGCEACRQICPKQCITMLPDDKGFIYPKINQSACIDCKLCQSVCPLHSTVEAQPNDNCYIYLNNDEKYRLQCASSGAFESLCKSFAGSNKEVVVFGCEMSDDFQVMHSYCLNYKGIDRFKKSKYLQSKIGDSFIHAKRFLQEGKFVIFSGVPCQVYGLKKFLRKNYDNLLLIDLLCHGIPSQKVFNSYIRSLQFAYGKKVIKYNFRHKEIYMGKWQNLSVKATFSNGKDVSLNCSEDLYMVGFLSGLFNRDCCYECKFASTSRCSDLTIGDFWGISEYNPEYDESKTNGTSLIIASTEKGRMVLKNLDDGSIEEVPLSLAIPFNGQLTAPQKIHDKRNLFFSNLKGPLGFIRAMSACFPEEYSIRSLLLKRLYAQSWYKKLSTITQQLFKR